MILNGFENLSGSTFDDNLTGDGNDNVLAGDTGNDNLVGGGGMDILYGDGRIGPDTHGTGTSGPIVTTPDVVTLDPMLVDGNDVLEGGLGNDQLFGGGGSDTASYAGAGGSVFVNLQGRNVERRRRLRRLQQHRECHRFGLQRFRFSAAPATM